MLTRSLIALLVAAAALAPTVVGEPDAGATRTVNLEVTFLGAVPHRDCDVITPAGATVGQLLDAAVEQGCIDSWDYVDYGKDGRFVTSIDGIPGAIATYWAFYVDGVYWSFGIDQTFVEDGETFTLNYEQWIVPV